MTRHADHRQTLRDSGYVLLRGAGVPGLVDLIETLGRVLFVEEVVVDASSPSLVKSSAGLSLHTDHHRADLIVWHCIAQSDEGGETLIADGIAALDALSPAQRSALATIELQEHSVFRGDADRCPVLFSKRGADRIYYSYWLADQPLSPAQRDALDAFEHAVQRGPCMRIRLEPGDVLAIDNGRMVHGRASINGSRERHLRRYWIEVDAF